MSLQSLSTLAVEVFVFPIVATLWFNDRATVGGGWKAVAISYFWLLIRIGFDVRDPILSISPLSPDFETAVIYYAGYFTLLIALGAIVGWLIALLMDIGEPIGFHNLFPSFRTHNLDNVVSTPCNPVDLVKLRDYLCNCDKGIEAWCFTHIEANYWHIFVGLVLVLITLFLPSILFWLLIDTNKWLAFALYIVLAAIGYFAAWFYWSYFTGLREWGPSAYNMAHRLEAIQRDPYNSIYAEDPDITPFAEALYTETQARINKTVLIMVMVHLIGFLLIGGFIVFPSTPTSLTTIVIVGLVFLLAIAFVILLLAFITFSRRGLQPMCPKYCPKTGLLLTANTNAVLPLSSNNTANTVFTTVTQRKPLKQKAIGNYRANHLDGL